MNKHAMRRGMAMAALAGSLVIVGSAGAKRPPAAPKVLGVVNLNTATEKQLTLLPGVGPSRAKAIVAYRATAHFAKVEDVRKVKGVGRGVFKRLQGHVAVNGPNTLAKVAEEGHAAGPR